MTARDWLHVRCIDGNHDWKAEGGRPCPMVDQDSPCPARNLFCSRPGIPSQPVFRCAACGDYDYGQRGGPGRAECERECMQ